MFYFDVISIYRKVERIVQRNTRYFLPLELNILVHFLFPPSLSLSLSHTHTHTHTHTQNCLAVSYRHDASLSLSISVFISQTQASISSCSVEQLRQCGFHSKPQLRVLRTVCFYAGFTPLDLSFRICTLGAVSTPT